MCEVTDQTSDKVLTYILLCISIVKFKSLSAKGHFPPTTFVLCKTFLIKNYVQSDYLNTLLLSNGVLVYVHEWTLSMWWWFNVYGADSQPMTSELGMTDQCCHHNNSLYGQPNESNNSKCDNNLNIVALNSCTDVTQLLCVCEYLTQDQRQIPGHHGK